MMDHNLPVALALVLDEAACRRALPLARGRRDSLSRPAFACYMARVAQLKRSIAQEFSAMGRALEAVGDNVAASRPIKAVRDQDHLWQYTQDEDGGWTYYGSRDGRGAAIAKKALVEEYP